MLGFRLLIYSWKSSRFPDSSKNFTASFVEHSIEGEACILIKPQTFMNRVGLAVAECAGFYKIPAENIVIISDDLDLPPGMARFRDSGGHGGHNGLRSVIDSLGNSKFRRVRFGIGRPAGKRDVVGYVLGQWSKAEAKLAQSVMDLGVGGTDRIFGNLAV